MIRWMLALGLAGCGATPEPETPAAPTPAAEARLRFTRGEVAGAPVTRVGVVWRTSAGAVGTVELGALAGTCAEEETRTTGLWTLQCDGRAVQVVQRGDALAIEDSAAAPRRVALPTGLELRAALPAAPAPGEP